MPLDPALLEPFEKLVRVRVLGKPLDLPANNTLLRGFQYLSPGPVSHGRFCWNRSCGNSTLVYRLPGDARVRDGRACCLRPVDGMEIVALSRELMQALRDVIGTS